MIQQGKYRQPWLQHASFDVVYMLLPGFLALLITIFLPQQFKTTDQMPVWAWVVLILLVDVAHVYSTLFRTYWDKRRFSRHKTLYIAIPIVCYIAGVFLYTLDALFFWRILAYLAVYHFIRQQYGIMRLYTRAEEKKTLSSRIDAIAIYAATLYPIVYWHCTPGRNFNWFVEGDFWLLPLLQIKQVALYLYLIIITLYVGKELYAIIKQRAINIPKNLVIISTFLTWYFGIVYYNGDMTFTLLNVVSHGIPYMALVWLFRKKEEKVVFDNKAAAYLPKITIAFFLLSIIGFAYLEEGFWDGLVWREHGSVFGIFSALPAVRSKELLALLIPLLSLPQSTHYVLDGFIWKKGHGFE